MGWGGGDVGGGVENCAILHDFTLFLLKSSHARLQLTLSSLERLFL